MNWKQLKFEKIKKDKKYLKLKKQWQNLIDNNK